MLSVALLALAPINFCWGLESIPDKLVVLTFDDASKSHYTHARPLLKRFGFGATFFITEGFDFPTNKVDYMTWEQIAELDRDEFEIGNHTRDHMNISRESIDRLEEQVEAINKQCEVYNIKRPVSFCYPGNSIVPDALPILHRLGFMFARRGGAPEYEYREGLCFAFEPGKDHPLLIPSAGDARPDWTLDNFVRAVTRAHDGRIAVLQLNTAADKFDGYMNYLAKNGFKVIAMRDLAKYVDPEIAPADPLQVIEERQKLLKQQR